MDAGDETVAEDVDWVDDDEDADADADDAAKSSGGSSSAPLLLCEAVLAAGARDQTVSMIEAARTRAAYLASETRKVRFTFSCTKQVATQISPPTHTHTTHTTPPVTFLR